MQCDYQKIADAECSSENQHCRWGDSSLVEMPAGSFFGHQSLVSIALWTDLWCAFLSSIRPSFVTFESDSRLLRWDKAANDIWFKFRPRLKGFCPRYLWSIFHSILQWWCGVHRHYDYYLLILNIQKLPSTLVLKSFMNRAFPPARNLCLLHLNPIHGWPAGKCGIL
jgi:hypothetical protein